MVSFLSPITETFSEKKFLQTIESKTQRISEGVQKNLIAPYQEVVARAFLCQAEALVQSDDGGSDKEVQMKVWSRELDRLYYLARVDTLCGRICDLAEEARGEQVDTQQIRLRTLEEVNNAKQSLSKQEASEVMLQVAGNAAIKWLECFGNQLHRLRAEAKIRKMYQGREGDEDAGRLLQLALSRLSADSPEAMMTLGDIEKVVQLAKEQLDAISIRS